MPNVRGYGFSRHPGLIDFSPLKQRRRQPERPLMQSRMVNTLGDMAEQAALRIRLQASTAASSNTPPPNFREPITDIM